MTPTTGAVVLAAGLGRRFGGSKLLAELDGQPLLQRVLDTLAELPLEVVVVVLGRDADTVERSLHWRAEHRIRNEAPERGLAESLKLGLAGFARGPRVERALLVLGDQPRLTVAQARLLLRVPPDASRPIVVPRYAAHGPGNPVLLERAAWPLAAELYGDRGMSQLFAARPELVRHVDVPGDNPDVDTPDDLARLRAGDVSPGGGPARSGRTAGADRSRP